MFAFRSDLMQKKISENLKLRRAVKNAYRKREPASSISISHKQETMNYKND